MILSRQFTYSTRRQLAHLQGDYMGNSSFASVPFERYSLLSSKLTFTGLGFKLVQFFVAVSVYSYTVFYVDLSPDYLIGIKLVANIQAVCLDLMVSLWYNIAFCKGNSSLKNLLPFLDSFVSSSSFYYWTYSAITVKRLWAQ